MPVSYTHLPGAGFAVGAVADMIGGVLAGYAINPLIALGAGATVSYTHLSGMAGRPQPGRQLLRRSL